MATSTSSNLNWLPVYGGYFTHSIYNRKRKKKIKAKLCFQGRFWLTANVDPQFAEICAIGALKLQNDVSVRRQARVTALVDCSSSCDSARIPTTHGVVPQSRCRDAGWLIAQTNDEIVRSITYTKVKWQNCNTETWRHWKSPQRVAYRAYITMSRNKAC